MMKSDKKILNRHNMCLFTDTNKLRCYTSDMK